MSSEEFFFSNEDVVQIIRRDIMDFRIVCIIIVTGYRETFFCQFYEPRDGVSNGSLASCHRLPGQLYYANWVQVGSGMRMPDQYLSK